MTRGRKRTALMLLALLLTAGGIAWYWRATAINRQVDALLAETRQTEPGGIEGWLIKLGLREDRRSDRHQHEVADDLAKLGPSAVPVLISALQESDPSDHQVVIRALGKLGDPRAVEPVILALHSEKGRLQQYAIWALGDLGNIRAAEPLVELIHDEDVGFYNQVIAIVALYRVGDPRGIEFLMQIVTEGHENHRILAVRELTNLKPSEIKPLIAPLIKALRTKNRVKQMHASSTLGEIGGTRTVALLKPLLKDSDGDLRFWAKKAIDRINARIAGAP